MIALRLANRGPADPCDTILSDYWRADFGTTIAGGNVTNWKSRTSSIVASEATHPPLFVAADAETGQACIQFDGNITPGLAMQLKIPAASFTATTAGGDRTYVLVRRARRISGTADYVVSSSVGDESIMSSSAGGKAAVATVTPLGASISREVCVEVYRISGGNAELWRDGVLVGAAAVATVDLSASALAIGSGGFNANGASMDLFAFGVHRTRAITDAEIGQITAFWTARASLKGTLLRTGTVMCFGDSRTQASVDNGTAHDPVPNASLQPTSAWREALRAMFPGVAFVGSIGGGAGGYCAHEGVAGNTFAQGQARLAAALAANPNPAVMIVWFGLNDASGGSSGATIAAALQAFVTAADAITGHGTQYLIVDETPNASGLINPRLTAYNAAIAGTITTLQGLGINATKVVAGSLCALATDVDDTGHPTATGHLKVARAVAAALKVVLPRAALRQVVANVVADTTTASAAFVDLLVTSITPSRGFVDIDVRVTGDNSTAGPATNSFQVLVDGAKPPGAQFAHVQAAVQTQSAGWRGRVAVAAGQEHKIQVQWKTSAGSARVRPVSVATDTATLVVNEVP